MMNRLIRVLGGSIRKRLILAGLAGVLAIAGISAYVASGSSSANTQAVAASPSSPAAGIGTTSPALPTADGSVSAPATAASVAAPTTAPPATPPAAATTKAAAQAASKPKTTTKPSANPTHSAPAGDDCLTTISASVVSENWNGRVLDLTVHLSIPQLPHACPVTISLTAYSASGDALATKTASTSTSGPGDVSADLDFTNVGPCISQFSSGRVTVGTESGYPLNAAFPPSSGC